MNTSKIRRFSQFLCRELESLVLAKLEVVLKEDSSARRESKKAVEYLEEQIKKTSKKAVIERVTYTWFNRFCALRYMDINRYNKILVVSTTGDYIQPEILVEAKAGHIDDDITDFIDKDRLFGLLSGKIKSDEPQQEAYKLLLIAVCNYYHTLMPFLFEKIEDHTELLLPSDLLSGKSPISYVREALLPENSKDVEIIGWLYQFYISEKKDKVFEDLKNNKKITPENIPAATQLFTPKWIVKYMVENSLGRLWLENRPNSKLREKMKYYIENESCKGLIDQTKIIKISSPEEIKILDPACGSGHILVYAFELLYLIYEEEGYADKDIPKLILENNLFGLEIDERAGELASFSLFMKARDKYKRFFTKQSIKPKICVFEKVDITKSELDEYITELGIENFASFLEDTISQFKNIDNFGSLTKPVSENIKELKEKLSENPIVDNLFLSITHEKVLKMLEQVEYLSNNYHCVIANPPYMGVKGMNTTLSDFVKKNYPDSKSDLMTCFMERCLEFSFPNGYVSMVNMQSWMFLSSYEELRKKIINQNTIISMAHLGSRGFDSIGGEVVQTTSFTIKKSYNSDFKGAYLRLIDSKNEEEKQRDFIKNSSGGKLFYRALSKDFNKIPGLPIAYWVSDKVKEIFVNSDKIGNKVELKAGLSTGYNTLFQKRWFEVNKLNIGLNFISCEQTNNSDFKWYPCNSGGEFKKWYGNNEIVINWKNNGFEIKNFRDANGNLRSAVRNSNYYFREGITWTKLSSSNFSVRYKNNGFVFDDTGRSAFIKDNTVNKYITSFLCSKLSFIFLSYLNPTMTFTNEDISILPIIFSKNQSTKEKIDILTQECIDISKEDWDSRETSWDFTKNELLKNNESNFLEGTYDKYCKYWQDKFYHLHKNEEELNKLFIDIYELQDELTPDVELKDITILKEETDIKDGELVFDKVEVIKQFISYSVGCIFGRYSLDKEGLILANQGETLQDFIEKVCMGLINQTHTFTPCENNIIPFMDGNWFEDDISEKLTSFLKASFGEENYSQNLSFIEDSLGKKIGNYFQKDFYNDHIKRYKKRPIYWMFSSPKETFNVLIYMHRYKEETISIILNNYLRSFRDKLISHKEHLESLQISSSLKASEKTKALKDIDTIRKQIEELNNYEHDILYPLAIDPVKIDLDDGVLVNYKKFGKALKKVAGLS